MQIFDSLSLDCPLLGPHLLEASAGTGKTFAMEHVVVRLLLEKQDLKISDILAITFTKAAARDLRARIYRNLQERLLDLEKKKSPFAYLEPYFEDLKFQQRLKNALELFDQAQIFTIHSFCYRMLQEFSLEANLFLSMENPDSFFPKKDLQEIRHFFEKTVTEKLLSSQQILHLLKTYKTWKELIDAIFQQDEENVSSFEELETLFLEKREAFFFEKEKLLDDYEALASQYKQIKGDAKAQLMAFYEKDFDRFLKEKRALFQQFAPQNRRQKPKEIQSLSYPLFFKELQDLLEPLVKEAFHTKKMLALLHQHYLKEKKGFMRPDQILQEMKKALEEGVFAEKVRNRYRVVIVDEFQDTDPTQWEIIQSLFLDESKELDALYLVGDPKQSIYRFRKADIYTYFDAKKKLGEKALFSLTTNYRSSPSLIHGLNSFFARNWLFLPKTQEKIFSPEVKPGLEEKKVFEDGKKPIHFAIIEEEEEFIHYALLEMKKLQLPLHHFAFLVKDRFQGEKVIEILQKHKISAKIKSPQTIGETPFFQAFLEWVGWLAFPSDVMRKRAIELGPFQELASEEFLQKIEKEGLSFLSNQLLFFFGESRFQNEVKGILVKIFEWSLKSPFSLMALLRFLQELKHLTLDEGAYLGIDPHQEGVEVVTIHSSKGLEFDVVFLLGACKKQGPGEEEKEESLQEKRRLFYVAMTRAKSRVYVALDEKEKGSLIQDWIDLLEKEGTLFSSWIQDHPHMSIEKIEKSVSLVVTPSSEPLDSFEPPSKAFLVIPCKIESFSSLCGNQKGEKPLVMPRDPAFNKLPKGPQVGVVIHELLEKLFRSKKALWKDDLLCKAFCFEELEKTFLASWKEEFYSMIEQSLSLILDEGFSLKSLEPHEVHVEWPFLFEEKGNYLTGMIDLVLLRDRKFYFIDWKSNVLTNLEIAKEEIAKLIQEHRYDLQAKIYQKALEGHFAKFQKEMPFSFGGAYYLFLRGAFLWKM